ncbi:hypothetical protein TNCV_3061031 [Trichonephila clavipes]|nr:hypothetical protein TNCV_3061031 [Trichonephila clavipes]
MGLQFLFMDDNAMSSHSSCEQLLESEDIECMDWPARSRDPQSHRACMGFSRQTLGSSYLTNINDSELRLALQDE